MSTQRREKQVRKIVSNLKHLKYPRHQRKMVTLTRDNLTRISDKLEITNIDLSLHKFS